MRIIEERPPNFADIVAVFPMATKAGVIFAWGDAIYNPSGIVISPALMEHEGVHGRRQGDDPASWWRNYLSDPAFRLREEILAHCREYGWLCANGNRHARRAALVTVAGRLSSPLYGQMISPFEARRILKDAAREARREDA